MPDDLAAERQITNVVLTDSERELVGLRPGEELRRGGKGVLDEVRRNAVISDHEKAGVFEGARDSAREQRRGAGITGEIGPDIKHRDAAVTPSAPGA
jgi:hypothetical protein